MFTPKGKFGWYELMTTDTKAAACFYSSVVGWSPTQVSADDDNSYTTFNLGDVGVAGMLNVGGHTAWIGYIAVDDVDAHIEKVVEAGGKLWKPATNVPGMLRFAVLSDPQGAPIVVFTPNPAMGTPQRPAPPAPGTIGWHELYTTDLEAASDFYNKLFGWTKLTDMEMGPGGTYRIFDQGENKPNGRRRHDDQTSPDPKLSLDVLLPRRLHQRSHGTYQIWRRQRPKRPPASPRRRLGHQRPRPAGSHLRPAKQQRITTTPQSRVGILDQVE
jgi:predicted enzyme related to lactoylglutathione lyase